MMQIFRGLWNLLFRSNFNQQYVSFAVPVSVRQGSLQEVEVVGAGFHGVYEQFVSAVETQDDEF